MSADAGRKEILRQLHEAYNLVQEENYTRAFNLLISGEKNNTRLYLRSRIVYLKLNCLLKVGNIRAAGELVEAELNLFPLSGQINLVAAFFFHQTGNFHKANRLFLRCCCLYPENISYAMQYVHFLKQRGKLSEANGILARCLLINRKRLTRTNAGLYQLYLELAQSAYQSGLWRRALTLFKHCEKQQRGFHFYDLMAQCMLNLNHAEGGVDYIRKHLVEWGESEAEALFIYAKCLAALGRYDQALQLLNRCRDIWGELVITGEDLAALAPLLQNGSLKNIENSFIDI